MSGISDNELITGIVRMQYDLSLVMSDLQELVSELQKRAISKGEMAAESIVSKKKRVSKKTKVPADVTVESASKKQNNGILIFNAYKNIVRAEIEKESRETPLGHKELMEAIRVKRDAEPESYKKFSDEWLAANLTGSEWMLVSFLNRYILWDQNLSIKKITDAGFDPATYGLWAHRASPAPQSYIINI